MPQRQLQTDSQGISTARITEAVKRNVSPAPGLRWLDVGCGYGDLVRWILAEQQPESVSAVDILPWLPDDLIEAVDYRVGPAEEQLRGMMPVDRLLMIETLEHVEAPWALLRMAAGLLRPGGLLIITTPNIFGARSRLDMALRSQLTAFRTDYVGHLTPVLPHAAVHVLEDAGLHATTSFTAIDMMPASRKDRPWPGWVASRWPRLTSASLLVVGEKP